MMTTNNPHVSRSIGKRWRHFIAKHILGKRWWLHKVNGMQFLLRLSSSVDRRMYSEEIYERAQLEKLSDYAIKFQPAYFFDIGAHAGLYAVYMASKTPVNVIAAFEPDPRNRAQLYTNLLLNNLIEKVVVHEFALGAYDGAIGFLSSQEANTGQSRVSESTTHSVSLRKLDSVYELTSSRLMFKIDVEGHEQEVIKGAISLLEKNKCLLQIESFSDKIETLQKQLEEKGYRCINRVGDDYYFTNCSRL